MFIRIIIVLTLLISLLSIGIYLGKDSLYTISESSKQIFYWILSFILLSLSFIYRKRIKDHFKKRSTYYNANLALIFFLTLGIILFSNYIASSYTWRFDLTKEKIHSLSQQSVDILKKIPEKIELLYFDEASPYRQKIKKTLELYRHENKLVEYRVMDPNAYPTLAQSLKIDKMRTLAVRYANKEKSKLFKAKMPTEQKITNTILKLIKEKEPKIYFLKGHGERSEESKNLATSISRMKSYIEEEVYKVKDLYVMKEGAIPSDTDVLVILGPRRSFFPKEIELIKAYFKNGGRLLIAFDLDIKSAGLPPGAKQLAKWLKEEHALNVGTEILVDTASRLLKQEAQVVIAIPSNPDHPITKDFPTSKMQYKKIPAFYFPLSTLFWKDNKTENSEDIILSSLVQSSPQAWAESNWDDVKKGHVSYNPKTEERGSMDIALSIEDKKQKSRMVLFATSAFLVNGLIDSARNKDLLLNTLAWLSSQEDLISIRAKERKDTELHMDKKTINFIFWMIVLIIPCSFLCLGLWTWKSRKNK